MLCPYCKHEETKVLDKRETPDLKSTRRRRSCLKCEKRFTTYEHIDLAPLTVIKKQNIRVNFNREKLISSMLKATEKRHITREQIENLADDIEMKCREKSNETSTKFIGTLVMNRLKKLDKVAYIRFASVYKEFKDIDEFQSELNKLR